MPRIERPVRTVSASNARANWSGLLNEVYQTRERVVVERSGVPLAAIISIADLKWLMQLEAQRDRDFAVLDEIHKAFEDVSDEEIERETAKALAEVRAEMQAEYEQRLALESRR
ncbi:MAG: type II toxin-antitoxin system prevent-host-death family antitoxin [Chloroflexota bacterium]